jgi:septum formation protein
MPVSSTAALPPVILASQSPRRRELLARILPDFTIQPSPGTELHDPSLNPRVLCETNARRKALPVAVENPDALVLGADTLVFLDRMPLGKPAHLEAARETLHRLSGRIHEVITGVSLAHAASHRIQTFSDVTFVKFKPLTHALIDRYLEQVHVLDKAGSYALQEEGHILIDQVEGSVSNVIGLPLEALSRALEAWLPSVP